MAITVTKIQETDPNTGEPITNVRIDDGNGNTTWMSEATYNDTLPSESSIPTTPQAGA